MMMPCGHVIAKESMQKLAKGGGYVISLLIIFMFVQA
jgi:hypothetical protein